VPDPNSIRIKRSNTSTNVPASLLNGELAANSFDQKLWIGNSSNTPILLSDITNTFVNQGAWDYNATYNKNTVVTYAGIFYYSVSAVPPYNTQPNVNPTYWSVLSDPAAVGGTYLPLAGGAMTGSITSVGATHDTEVAGEFFGVQLSADHTQGTMVNFDGLDTYNGASHMFVNPTGLTFPDSTTQTTAYTGGAGVSSVTAGTGISVDKTTGDLTVSSTITQYADSDARASLSSTATGLTYTSATGVFSLTASYAIPTTTSQTNWDTAYTQKGQWTGGSTNLVAATGRTSLGLVIGTNVQAWDADLDAIGAIAGTTGILKKTAANTWSLDTTAYTANTGTVTSVSASVPTGLSISGSPVTSSGTLAISLTAGYAIPTTASQTNWDSGYNQRLQWDGGATNLSASTARTSLGATTVGGNLLTLVNPSAVTFPRLNLDNTVSALDAVTFRTAIGAGTSSASGTVTSVSMTVPTGLTITGSPVTASGTLAITLTSGYSIPTSASQTTWDTAYTNRITSLTTTGTSGAATLAANVLNIPNHTLAGLGGQTLSTNLTSLSGLSYVSASFVKMSAAGTFALDTSTYLTANQTVTLSGDVSGSGTTAITTTLATVPIAKGGTGQITANAAINALLPSQTSSTGKYLTTNGTDSSWGAVVGGPSFTASATAPVSPVSGDRWFDTSIGVYFTYFNDGTSSQWVETSNSGTTVNAINENLQTIDTNKTLTASSNGTSLGPITINTAVTVTLGNGQRWIIL
jgi:hypothetical protein